MNTHPITAEILESSAAGYASAASALLLESGAPSLPDGWGSVEWKSHLKQRILEIATAVRVNEPQLFARRVNWLRRAVRARGANESDLRTAIESIRAALDNELPDEMKGAVEQPIALALAEFDLDVEPEAAILRSDTPLGRLAIQYLATCLEARTTDATQLILNQLETGVAAAEIYSGVLLPAQRETGRLWHLGDVSISEERVVSETTRTVMNLIVHLYAPKTSNGRTVVAASVAGNAHDIGIRALANLFQLDGWRSVFLGANVPATEIAYAAQAFDADLLLINATLTTQLGSTAEILEKVRQVAASTKVLVGGLAFEEVPNLWRQLGADGYAADIDSALKLGNALTGFR